MDDNYLLIKNFIDFKSITNILNLSQKKNEVYSKVGNRVGKEKKIRKDVFFSKSESNKLDIDIFDKVKPIVETKFNKKLKYRETYKLGTYYCEEKGFYIPHTDTQGIMQHRRISIVICLSKKDNYEGGIFKFINLKKEFKFDIGDAIIFDSNLLHGVEPVTSGKRQVLVSFMWDEEGEQIRQKNNPTVSNSNYLTSSYNTIKESKMNTVKQYNSSYKWIEPYINLEQKDSVILECGSYNGLDAVYLSEYYKRKVYSFEALPTLIENAKKNTKNYNVEVVNAAVCDIHNKIVKFYKSDDKYKKSSSLYNKTTKTTHNVMTNPTEFDIKGISLYKWIEENNLKNKVELIVMDLQGAELLALEGLIPFDKSLKYIVVEADFNQIYDNCSTIKDIAIFLEKYNFYPIKMSSNRFSISDIYSDKYFNDKRGLWSDCLFERSDTKENIKTFSINDLIVYKTDFKKTRIGRNSDGGYVILDIPSIEYDMLISGGISNDDSFEHDFIKKYKNVSCEAFNYSVDDLPNPSEKIHFNKKFIGIINNDKYTNLEFYMKKYNNIFLKLDIEGSEHKWFDYLNETQLNNISQMVVEFHYYPNIKKNFKYFSKINKHFYLIHLHANNCRTKNNVSGLFKYNENNIPWVFECTFVNKRYINNVKVNNIQVPDNRFDYKNISCNDDINLNYFPYKFENDRLITLIPPDSGPGNQIIGIKECLILSKLLNRICIIPPIREHYLKNRNNNIFYKFTDIYSININSIIIDDDHSTILNHIDNRIRYCIHSNYYNKKLYHENIINSLNNNEIILKTRLIKKTEDLEELKNLSDNLIIIKHLFNNIHINESGVNGDFYSNLNNNFKDIYTEICSKLDFSDNIKLLGNEYINNTFNNFDYIAIHIRFPDIFRHNLDEYTNNTYNINKILKIISNLKIINNKPIFIATNNVNIFTDMNIKASFLNKNHKYSSFIEQYICCTSKKFYYLNLCDERYNKPHNRSTFTSFIIDYRLYLNKYANNYNLHKFYKY